MTQIATATARYRHAGLARMVFWGLLGLLVSPLLFADSSVTIDTMKAASSDGSMQALGKLFGSANGLLSGSGADWLSGTLLHYNLGVLAAASMWFSWNIASGISQGSFDGEFLGKRYHTLWMPIRNVTGISLMIPAWAGWTLAQLAMAYAANLGMGLASGAAIHIPAASFPISTPVARIPAPREVITSMESGMKCVMEKRLDIKRLVKANTDPAEPSLSLNWGYQVIDRVNSSNVMETGVDYGVNPSSDGFTSTSCGHFVYTLSQPTASDSPAVADAVTTGNNVFKAIIADMSLDLQSVYDEALGSIADPDDPSQVGLAQVAITTGTLAVLEKWTDFYNAVNSAQGGSQTASNRTQEAVTNAINASGWIGAGTAGATQIFDSIATEIKSPKPSNDNTKEDSVCSITDWLTDTSSCVSKKTKSIFAGGGLQNAVGTVSGSPFVFAPKLGLDILFGIDKITGVILLTGAAIAVGAALPVIGGAAQSVLLVWLKVLDIFMVISVPLAMFALQAAIMIPAEIVIAWVFAVASYYVIYMEAILAAPLWALAHMDTDGEGMGQRTTHGYLFLLNLLFRPIILVITIGFAYAFAEVVGTMMNGALGQFAVSLTKVSEDNWFVGLLLLIGCIWLLIRANLKVAGVAASLLSDIPNQVFSWLGGQFGSNVGSGVGAQVAGDFGQGLQKAGNLGQAAAQDAVGEAKSNLRAGMEENKRKAEAERAMTPGTKEYELNQKRANVSADQAAKAEDFASAARANRLANGSIGQGGSDNRSGSGDAPSGGGRSSGLESGPAKGEKAYSAGKAMGSAMRNAATQAGALGKGVVDGLSRGRASAESAGDNPGSEGETSGTEQKNASGSGNDTASTPGGSEVTGGARGMSNGESGRTGTASENSPGEGGAGPSSGGAGTKTPGGEKGGGSDSNSTGHGDNGSGKGF